MVKTPTPDTSIARRTAVLALIVVVIEASLASLVTLVPGLSTLGTRTLSAWALVTAPAVVALVGLGLLVSSSRSRWVSALGVALVAVSIGALMGALGAVTPSLRGAGLAFAAPLVVGEVFAAGAWLARKEGERLATFLALLTAALTTCAAAFLTERLDVEMAPLAIGVAGVCAQLQLAMARVGEAGAVTGGVHGLAARFGAVPRSLVLAALGRSGSQGDA